MEDIAGLETDLGTAIPVGLPDADGNFDLHLFRFPSPMSGKGFMNVKFEIPPAT